MGNCSSYDEVERVHTSLAKEVVAKSLLNNAMLPSNISPNGFIQVAADNNDINEETLDGRNTTHATTVVVYQRRQHGPECPPKVLTGHSIRKRSIEPDGTFNGILDFWPWGKSPLVKTFLGTLHEDGFQVAKDLYLSSLKTDLLWAFARMPPSLEGEANQVIPSWSGFNALVLPATPCSSAIGYCPMLNGSSTQFSTIYTVMKNVQKMCAAIAQTDSVLTFDMAIYVKAKLIQWSSPDEFIDTVIRMGGFHIVLNFLALIGKKYQNSGLEDLLIESGVYMVLVQRQQW